MAKEAMQYVYIPELDKDGKRARLTLGTDKHNSDGLYSFAQMEFQSPDGGTSFLLCFAATSERTYSAPGMSARRRRRSTITTRRRLRRSQSRI